MKNPYFVNIHTGTGGVKEPEGAPSTCYSRACDSRAAGKRKNTDDDENSKQLLKLEHNAIVFKDVCGIKLAGNETASFVGILRIEFRFPVWGLPFNNKHNAEAVQMILHMNKTDKGWIIV